MIFAVEVRVTCLDTGTRFRRHAVNCGGMAFLLAPQRQVPTPSIPRQSRQLGGINALPSAETPIIRPLSHYTWVTGR